MSIEDAAGRLPFIHIEGMMIVMMTGSQDKLSAK